jgi:predicted phosphodiesterase
MAKKPSKKEPTLLEILEQNRDKRSRPTNYIRHNFTEDKPMIVPYSDIHWGSPHCNKNKFLDNLEKTWQNKNSYIIMNGDMLEAATRTSVGGGIYEQKIHTGQQLEELVAMFKPFSEEKRIIGITNGNHEDRISDMTGVDITQIISKELNTPYFKHGGFFRFKTGKENYSAYFTHGHSGSRLPYTKIKACLNLATFLRTDLYAIGHVHDLQHHTQEYQEIDYRNDCVKYQNAHFLINGHYLNWKNSYAQKASMQPSKQGTPLIELYSDRHEIKVTM